jgi:hypothetical protein
MTSSPPKVLVSYSHDSELHKDWVLTLATRLVANGVNIFLDQWDLAHEEKYAELLRDIHGQGVKPRPPLGANPFLSTPTLTSPLGRVDGFDQDEAADECEE